MHHTPSSYNNNNSARQNPPPPPPPNTQQTPTSYPPNNNNHPPHNNGNNNNSSPPPKLFRSPLLPPPAPENDDRAIVLWSVFFLGTFCSIIFGFILAYAASHGRLGLLNRENVVVWPERSEVFLAQQLAERWRRTEHNRSAASNVALYLRFHKRKLPPVQYNDAVESVDFDLDAMGEDAVMAGFATEMIEHSVPSAESSPAVEFDAEFDKKPKFVPKEQEDDDLNGFNRVIGGSDAEFFGRFVPKKQLVQLYVPDYDADDDDDGYSTDDSSTTNYCVILASCRIASSRVDAIKMAQESAIAAFGKRRGYMWAWQHFHSEVYTALQIWVMVCVLFGTVLVGALCVRERIAAVTQSFIDMMGAARRGEYGAWGTSWLNALPHGWSGASPPPENLNTRQPQPSPSSNVAADAERGGGVGPSQHQQPRTRQETGNSQQSTATFIRNQP